MIRSKSFSAYGTTLQRRSSMNPDIYTKNIQRGKQKPMQVIKKQSKFIEGFNRVTSRQKLNSFQTFHSRDCYNQTNYQIKQKLVTTRSALFPVRCESEPRLKKLIVNKQKYEPTQTICQKYQSDIRDENIMTARDLQKTRKSFHNIDFDRQNSKSHSYIKQSQGKQTKYPKNPEIMMKTTGGLYIDEKNQLNKLKSTHSFDSYTKRQFLSEKKLLSKGAPSFSGMESYKIPQEKFKGNWKVVSPVKFSSMPKKILNRYDRDCDYWYTKLQYQPKYQKKTPIMQMSKQTSRKENEVHSKYPTRLAA